MRSQPGTGMRCGGAAGKSFQLLAADAQVCSSHATGFEAPPEGVNGGIGLYAGEREAVTAPPLPHPGAESAGPFPGATSGPCEASRRFD